MASVQLRLGELGYEAGPVDGLMGPRTARAIREFQRDSGLPETGAIDELLYQRVGGQSAVEEAAARLEGRPWAEAAEARPPERLPAPPVAGAATPPSPEPLDARLNPVVPAGSAAGPAVSAGSGGYQGRWVARGADCEGTAAIVIDDRRLSVGGTTCAITNVSPVGATGTSWRLDASCPAQPEPVAFVLARSDGGDGQRLWLTSMSDGSVSFLERCPR